MEAKLKALKVVDLRAILTKADRSAPAKANKQELISRILASEKAISVYNSEHGPPDDLLAPPEDLDWNPDEVTEKSGETHSSTKPDSNAQAPKPPSKVADLPPAETATATATAPAPASPTQLSPEEEKRRKRAERFGIPVVQPQTNKPAAQPPVDSERLKARAARFGIQTDDTGKRLDTAQSDRKRASPATEQVDAEELERRKKRAARFNTQSQGQIDPEEQNKREQRAARFGIKPTT